MTDKTWHGCTANWNNSDGDKNWWIIRNAEQEELARFPYSMGEHAVMAVVHVVRDLETASYEAGKEFGGQAMMAAHRQKLTELSNHNTYLANKLESMIGDKG